ncbi:MAG: glycosyltransferase involved in cell wall biosynthesis [Cognaticolwellia sp.]|jgi:glycosyltransferase involved in cell wall biosynthesis
MRLHLAHGSPALGDRGGTELYADALVRSQPGAQLLAPDRGGPAGLRRINDHTWAVGVSTATRFRDTWSRPEVASAVAQLAPELVHAHHFAHVGLDALAGVDCPLVLSLHDYHLICVRGQLMDRDVLPCSGPSLKKCGACVAEHLALVPAMGPLGKLSRALGVHELAKGLVARAGPSPAGLDDLSGRMEAGRQILARAQVLLSPSRDLAQRVNHLGPNKAIEVLDLPLVAPLSPAPPPGSGPLRVLFMGALIPSKGLHLLIQAADALPALELQVWGPTPVYDADPDYGQRCTKALGARYGGVFDTERRQEILDGSDLLVVPSIWEENSPLVVREALAAGVRVVASDRGGIAEIDTRIQCFPGGDLGALRDLLREQIAQGRGRWSPRDFSMSAHLLALEDVYQRARAAWLR